MKDNPLVSIVIPAYNAEKYINETIDSMLAQTYSYFELIIADDCSTDSTRKLIDAYKDERIHRFHNKKNMGQLRTVNKLLNFTKGEFITIHDADDVSLPNRLELLLEAFTNDPELGMVGSWGELVTETGKHIDFDRRPEHDAEIRKRIKDRSAFLGAAVMIKREVLEKVGGYRPYFEFIGYKDYDWTYLVTDLFKVHNLQVPLYKYRQVASSNSKKVDPKRIVSDKVVQFLGKQRNENGGKDSLMQGDEAGVDAYMEKLLLPYKKDPSRIYREHAAMAMYNKMHQRAIGLSWQAIKTAPAKFENWRTFQYCLRKTCMGIKK
jgi:glycosyltransferase involved in cell wall biosynthesis